MRLSTTTQYKAFLAASCWLVFALCVCVSFESFAQSKPTIEFKALNSLTSDQKIVVKRALEAHSSFFPLFPLTPIERQSEVQGEETVFAIQMSSLGKQENKDNQYFISTFFLEKQGANDVLFIREETTNKTVVRGIIDGNGLLTGPWIFRTPGNVEKTIEAWFSNGKRKSWLRFVQNQVATMTYAVESRDPNYPSKPAEEKHLQLRFGKESLFSVEQYERPRLFAKSKGKDEWISIQSRNQQNPFNEQTIPSNRGNQKTYESTDWRTQFPPTSKILATRQKNWIPLITSASLDAFQKDGYLLEDGRRKKSLFDNLTTQATFETSLNEYVMMDRSEQPFVSGEVVTTRVYTPLERLLTQARMVVYSENSGNKKVAPNRKVAPLGHRFFNNIYNADIEDEVILKNGEVRYLYKGDRVFRLDYFNQMFSKTKYSPNVDVPVSREETQGEFTKHYTVSPTLAVRGSEGSGSPLDLNMGSCEHLAYDMNISFLPSTREAGLDGSLFVSDVIVFVKDASLASGGYPLNDKLSQLQQLIAGSMAQEFFLSHFLWELDCRLLETAFTPVVKEAIIEEFRLINENHGPFLKKINGRLDSYEKKLRELKITNAKHSKHLRENYYNNIQEPEGFAAFISFLEFFDGSYVESSKYKELKKTEEKIQELDKAIQELKQISNSVLKVTLSISSLEEIDSLKGLLVYVDLLDEYQEILSNVPKKLDSFRSKHSRHLFPDQQYAPYPPF